MLHIVTDVSNETFLVVLHSEAEETMILKESEFRPLKNLLKFRIMKAITKLYYHIFHAKNYYLNLNIFLHLYSFTVHVVIVYCLKTQLMHNALKYTLNHNHSLKH